MIVIIPLLIFVIILKWNEKNMSIIQNYNKRSDFTLALSKRIRIVYAIAAIETSLLIIVVFIQPVFTRMAQNSWQRYGSLVEWTLSLDVHVALAIPFLILFMIQFSLGLLQKPGNLINKIHRTLGKIILLYTPIFLITSIWNVYVRVPPLLLQLLFYIVITSIAYFLIRGFIAIRQKNYLKHIDSMLGAFILSGIAATARLVYTVFYLKYGSLYVTTAAWLLITSLVLYSKLFLFYALAGRVKQNTSIILIQLLPIVLIFSFLPWPPT